MAKPELGTKRLCGSCGAKFYDLNKDPITCPKCGAVFEAAALAPRRAEGGAHAGLGETEVEAPEMEEAEFVSLEEAEEEARGKKPIPALEEEEVDLEEALEEDDTFIEEPEEEDTDVSDILGGDIESEEET